MGTVNPSDLRTAATHLDGAATTVRGNVPSAVGDIATALAGSQSSGAANTLATAWERAVEDVAVSLDTAAENYRAVATGWEQADHSSARRFGGLVMRAV